MTSSINKIQINILASSNRPQSSRFNGMWIFSFLKRKQPFGALLNDCENDVQSVKLHPNYNHCTEWNKQCPFFCSFAISSLGFPDNTPNVKKGFLANLTLNYARLFQYRWFRNSLNIRYNRKTYKRTFIPEFLRGSVTVFKHFFFANYQDNSGL